VRAQAIDGQGAFEEDLPTGGLRRIPNEDIWLLRGGKTSEGHRAHGV